MSVALLPLLDLPGVEAAMTEARVAVDAALRHPRLRRSGGVLVAEAGLRSAVASAALEGYEHDLDSVRAGTVTDPVLQGALRVSLALDAAAPLWPRSPRQVLARLHLLAARGCDGVDESALGRPTGTPAEMARLDALCALLTEPSDGVPTLVRAAVIHGELLVLRPFAGPNGVVARAAARLTLISGGLDPRGLLAPEAVHAARQVEYVGSVNAFSTGTADGVRGWLRHCAAAVQIAAADAVTFADSLA